jgi:ribosomal protein S18 acetylase RimI-like enzyme
MIKEITFEEIKPYWEKYLWSEYIDSGCKISRVNLWTQKDYCYKVIDYISNPERILNPTYIAYLIDNQIVGVESGYKTNINYYRIRGLWVDKNHRHKGIAKKMVEYFDAISNERYMWSIPRETSLGFYLKYGFVVTGKVKSIYGQNYFVRKER